MFASDPITNIFSEITLLKWFHTPNTKHRRVTEILRTMGKSSCIIIEDIVDLD